VFMYKYKTKVEANKRKNAKVSPGLVKQSSRQQKREQSEEGYALAMEEVKKRPGVPVNFMLRSIWLDCWKRIKAKATKWWQVF